MYALNGVPVYNTPKVLGRIQGASVLTLLDSGSSHNVINAEMVKRLGCEVEETPAFKVTLADGKQVKGSTKCKCLKWEAEGAVFEIEALVLPLYDYVYSGLKH